MSKIDFLKHTALLEEFETAGKLIKLGFAELQNISLTNDFYFLPFQLLSQGFERFMKAYICVGYYNKYNKLPDVSVLKKSGHDLEKLLKVIASEYYMNDKREQFVKDEKFLNEDKNFHELLKILSEFGKFARYYNFDLITGNTNIGINPKDAWEKFEDRICTMNKIRIDKLTNPDLEGDFYQEINMIIISLLEKYISALSRQINFGTIGDLGKQLTINSFLEYGQLYEGNFGKTDYRSYPQKKEIDEFDQKQISAVSQIISNSNKKSKVIRKVDYKGDWPFCAEEVTVVCIEKEWCIVIINGRYFALNGLAASRYKIENPHDAGMAKYGVSIGEFIDIAKSIE